jgi:hypothetical protein
MQQACARSPYMRSGKRTDWHPKRILREHLDTRDLLRRPTHPSPGFMTPATQILG